MRILSYNIHKGIGGRDRRYQLPRILEVIEHARPDVLCLQEVARGARRSRRHNQPAILEAHLTELHRQPVFHLYQQTVRYKLGGYGNLLLSRWPILVQHAISLRHGQRKPRGAQLAVIDAPGGPVYLAHIHLGLSERERHWQMEHLLSHQLFRESLDLPTAIVGDTNDWRNTLARGRLAADGFVQVTSPLSRFRTFPAYMPVGSLDKAYCRGTVEVAGAHVVRSKLARVASDHLPLAVDLA